MPRPSSETLEFRPPLSDLHGLWAVNFVNKKRAKWGEAIAGGRLKVRTGLTKYVHKLRRLPSSCMGFICVRLSPLCFQLGGLLPLPSCAGLSLELWRPRRDPHKAEMPAKTGLRPLDTSKKH